MEIAFQAGAVLGLIALIVFLIMGRKSWKFFHSFILFLNFPLMVAIMFYSAMVLKSHVAWKQLVAENEVTLEKKELKIQQLTDGNILEIKQVDMDLLDVKESDKSLKAAKRARLRLMKERGTVWRDCQVTNVAASAIQLQLSTGAPPAAPPAGVPPAAPPAGAPADPAAPPVAVPVPAPLEKGATVVAFKEMLINTISSNWKVPVAYLGEFLVTDSTGTVVTLAPALPIDPVRDQQQLAQINARDGTWVLYKTMPLDGHTLFPPGLTEEHFRTAFPQAEMQVQDDVYQAILDQYVYDGQPVESIKQQINDPTRVDELLGLNRDATKQPTRQWYEVKFIQAHEIDVNSQVVAGSPLATEAFDPSGKAQLPDLLQLDETGKSTQPTEFEIGDVAIFDKDTADDLRAQGKVEIQKEIYRRELVDYKDSFRDIEKLRNDIIDRTAKAQRDVDDVKDALANLQKQIAYREGEITKLTDDLNNHRKEVQLVSAHRAKLEQEWAKLKDEIRKAYFANKHYEAQLAAMQQELVERVEKRTRKRPKLPVPSNLRAISAAEGRSSAIRPTFPSPLLGRFSVRYLEPCLGSPQVDFSGCPTPLIQLSCWKWGILAIDHLLPSLPSSKQDCHVPTTGSQEMVSDL